MRTIYETNVFGVVAVTNAMLPLLQDAAAARIVNVSSDLGSLTWALDQCQGTLGYATQGERRKSRVLRHRPQRAQRLPYGGAGRSDRDRLALLDPDGPTGAFLEDPGPLPW